MAARDLPRGGAALEGAPRPERLGPDLAYPARLDEAIGEGHVVTARREEEGQGLPGRRQGRTALGPSSSSEDAGLLRAAFLRGEEAVEAWRAFRASGRELDQRVFRALPQLYRNLAREGVADPLLPTLKGVHRFAWSRNQVLLRVAGRALRALAEAGVPTLVLGDVALSLCHDDARGPVVIEEVSLLVPRSVAATAANALARMGPTPSPVSSAGCVQAEAMELLAQGAPPLTLRSSLPTGLDPWESAVATSVDGVAVRALCPADQLLQTCVDGVSGASATARWPADAATIVAASRLPIDWERLVTAARRSGRVLPLREGLGALRARLDLPVPVETLDRLRGLRVGGLDRLEHRLRVDARESALARLAGRWLVGVRGLFAAEDPHPVVPRPVPEEG